MNRVIPDYENRIALLSNEINRLNEVLKQKLLELQESESMRQKLGIELNELRQKYPELAKDNEELRRKFTEMGQQYEH
jgi:chromosome segregation ATPase